MPLISADALAQFAQDMLVASGVPAHKAAIIAASLVASNLRGVDSHGIQLVPFYVEQMAAGDVVAQADGRIISETGACLLFDGQNGLGHWVADTCRCHAVRIAKQHGLAMVVARESNHFGAAAWWAQKMRAEGQIGIVMCNASPIVPPWQGKEGRLGTNPICMSVPGPWLLDMATTTVAAGRIFKAMINRQPEIPAGWAFNSEGVPTTNTAEAYKGMLMPLGGYKGSGLAMMVEILCSVLSGGAMANELGGIRVRGQKARNSQMFMAIDVAHFLPLEQFTQRMEQLVGRLKATPPAPGYEEVLVAGDPEWRTEAQRRTNGIPVPEGNWETLCKTAASLKVAAPSLEAK